MNSTKIFLVGMPGSGKSYFGKELAEYLAYPLIDLDQHIEEVEGQSISEIFSEKGEAYFRKVESEQLRKMCEVNQELLLSTGGGTPCFHDGMNYLNAQGITIFLETDRELLIERLQRKSHRPLLQGDVEATVDDLLSKRLPIYRQAHLTIAHREVKRVLDWLSANA